MFCLILVLFNFCGLRLSHSSAELMNNITWSQKLYTVAHDANCESGSSRLTNQSCHNLDLGSCVGTDHGIFHEEASGRRTGDSPTFLRARACSWCRAWWRCVFRCAWFSRILFCVWKVFWLPSVRRAFELWSRVLWYLGVALVCRTK
jgi:hypothetical protein